MALIDISRAFRSRSFLFMPLFFVLAGGLHGQSADIPVKLSLEQEIRTIEWKLADSARSGAERREAYIELARLQRLSGNIDASARAWLEAVRADPENRDHASSLESALCFLTLGEYEAAEDALQGILGSASDLVASDNVAGDQVLLRDARYIAAQIDVFRTGNPITLYALLGNPEFMDFRPAIYYTFWRIFSAPGYKAQILSEFPNSPEARILESEEALASGSNTANSGPAGPNSIAVSVYPRPLWFFFPGRENAVISASVPVRSAPLAQPSQAYSAPAAPNRAGNSSGVKALQTGLFSREENAQAMVSRLAARGFTGGVTQKLVNGITYWAVTISPGENPNQTILRLKDAGFESFPVF
ncbi:SPOR domain-containing protein [Treponema primitia]|nr:SPOR domain-containing protein [Treponema primitia]